MTVVGLAVGRGTGAEIAAVFERVLGHLAEAHGVPVTVERSGRVYDSYVSLRGAGVERTAARTAEDAAHYERFCRELAARGATAVFRTAINAQSLYLVRQRLRAVKVDALGGPPDGSAPELLLVRDQAQGFYTGDNTHSPGRVVRTMEFSEEITGEVLDRALRRARTLWPEGGAEHVVMAYKFHLLDGALDDWVKRAADRHGVQIRLCQPDTVNRDLITHGLPPRTVIVAGNEWGDIMHVMLLDRFGGERQETRCTENVHLLPDVADLVEYQTVHGSADDLEGRDAVNPVAAIRAAAAVAEHHAGCPGTVAAVETALAELSRRGVCTADLGGEGTTSQVVDALLTALGRVPGSEPGSTPGVGRDSVPVARESASAAVPAQGAGESPAGAVVAGA
ncbi:isocitrate/isopropylmalate family dehydrogenase [Streptomyces sp. NPDC091385]|uniref:isocitrate/isopropylmalate family dehydrogenase n=1 Tax=Streptomyces sp. NPDC091385 TaxID=3365997 RepID=UPI0037FB2254